MAKSESKFPTGGDDNNINEHTELKVGKEPDNMFKQSDSKKYKDNKIYKVILKKGGARDLDLRGKYLTFQPREIIEVEGKYLNTALFTDQENYFTVQEK